MRKTANYFIALETRTRKLDYLDITEGITDDALIDALVRITSSVEALANASGITLIFDHRGRVYAQNQLTGEVSYGYLRF